MMLPFDSHNHVHMGPSPPLMALVDPLQFFGSDGGVDGWTDMADATNAHLAESSAPSTSQSSFCKTTTNNINNDKVNNCFLSGMALMSTHPRDFPRVQSLVEHLPQKVQISSDTYHDTGGDKNNDNSDATKKNIPKLVACYGVHPWFLHELTDSDWEPQQQQQLSSSVLAKTWSSRQPTPPLWLMDMEAYLVADPQAVVGEIGLDGFHFDPTTKQLTSSMEQQVQALEWQLELAHALQRPVSVHAVQCFGPLMTTLSKFRRKMPPKVYFHAFGGKVGTVDQLLALCGNEIGQVYFGFAPVINFRSGKTADVARKVGLERLLLETDHEDASLVHDSMEQCISFMADCFQLDESVIVQQTTQNAKDFYGF